MGREHGDTGGENLILVVGLVLEHYIPEKIHWKEKRKPRSTQCQLLPWVKDYGRKLTERQAERQRNTWGTQKIGLTKSNELPSYLGAGGESSQALG